MEDCFPFPLWVEGDWNPGTTKLKNKLNIYFQSKKAKGGDCFVEYEASHGQRALVMFKTEEVRRRVVEKQGHELKIGQEVLKLTVRLPQSPEEKRTQNFPETSDGISSSSGQLEVVDGADGKKLSTQTQAEAEDTDMLQEEVEAEADTISLVLENVPEKMSRVMLEMLVENISDLSAELGDFSLEIIPDICVVVVSFQNSKKVHHFLSKCSCNKIFKNNKLSARALEITTSVKVDKIPLGVSNDHLQLYFERDGEVEEVKILEDEQSALITFKDHQVVNKVMKKPHCIEKTSIEVYLYYESLGTALYGKERPTLKLPDSFTEIMDSAVWKFLHDNQQVEVIDKVMAEHFCAVDLKSPEVHITPLPSLLKQKSLKANDWKENAASTFRLATSRFRSFECQVQPAVWKESEMEIRGALMEAVVLMPAMSRGVVALVGLAEDVSKHEEVLVEIVSRATSKFNRERDSITEEFPVAPSQYHILQQDGLLQRITTEYPELKMTYRREGKKIILSGLSSEVYSVKSKVLERIVAMKQKTVEVDENVLAFLCEVDKEELSDSLFKSQGINATYEMDEGRVQVLGGTDQALCGAEKQLKTVLGFYSMKVEDLNVLSKPEWEDLVTHLKKTFNSPVQTVIVYNTKLEVVVSGFQDTVHTVGEQLLDFMSKNTIIEETLDVKAKAILKYIQEHKKEILSEAVQIGVQINFNEQTRRPSISVRGPRFYVMKFNKLIGDMISSVHFDSLRLTKPGAKKFFKDKQDMYVGMTATKMGCVVQLVDEDLEEGFGDDKSVLELQVSGGVVITICKADICHYQVDAVVNAANENLKHEGGLVGALLEAAGPELQEQCDRLIAAKGALSPGDAVITGAGCLPCKHVIHGVCPRFDRSDSQRSVSILKLVVNQSLMLAEENSCLSVALPAISSGNMGFPLDMCADTIVLAIREHCENLYMENTLKKIHLVSNDDMTVQAMENAVQKVFTNLVPLDKTRHQAGPSTKEKQFGTVDSRLGQERVQTKEGLTITLTKGNIQDALMDVTVNTLGKNLSLDSGAVSKAILEAAGPELQNLVQAEAAGNNPTEGAVLVTKGCRLKSKHVFHAIAPHWDKGKGKAEKVLEGIVEECLGRAEQLQQESIAFSAIGSGNLGFPKDMVASIMLGEALRFSNKNKLKHLRDVVIILHPSDAQTSQAFTNEFNKRFTGLSATMEHPANPATVPAQPGKGLFSKVTSTKQGHEMRVGGVLLQVVTGDIAKETTDVIVNSSNDDFSLRSGVSKAILDAAGQAVDAECKQLGAQPNTDMIMTQPGKLKSKKIIHIVGQTDVAKILKTVKAVLKMCTQNKFSSVSFPALGTGQGGVNPSQVADTMLDAVADMVQQIPKTSLQVVRVIIFQVPMLADFHSSMQKREGIATQEKETILHKSFWKDAKKQDKKKAKNFSLGDEMFDPVIFHLCGESRANVEAAKKCIEDLFLQELTFQTVTEEAILDLSEEDHCKIRELQQKLQVSVRLEEGNKEASIILEGLSRDVLKAIGCIQDMLKKARTEATVKQYAELTSNLVQWHYLQGGQYLLFDSLSNLQLEQALGSQLPDVTVTIQDQPYKVSLPNGPAVDNGGNQLQIKRIYKQEAQEMDSLPKHWDAMTANQQCLMPPLQAGTKEYNEVLGLFQVTCPRPVSKIERIQNPCLWKNFQILKQSMDSKNGHQNNERRLFHGTSLPTIQPINHRGFNRSYAGKNAAAYGNGTYFAVAASYSAGNTYSVPDAQGQKYIYLCRVLTGDFIKGVGGMIAPPAKNNSSLHVYDSVTDNPANPSMFIIFNDIQAYPEYLITFR
ncbi:hypothetical protein AAFF_G00195360 [Aldrovandia affinis]|uniref:Poly [ADP-ribose] polymerase n=1 Tax=Aldrovandia affinis TaxID=143900 RepID=A0AAD7SYU6_9TELE|nr:hypothetical protein AAFF_G00195360 [Aldrovandia affinis]